MQKQSEKNKNVKIKYLIIPFLLLTAGLIEACGPVLNESQMLFEITDVYYQSWMAGEDENGTDIFIKMKNIDKDIKLISVIFRGIKVPLAKVPGKEELFLKGTIALDASIIENRVSEITGQPDQLLYRYNDIEYSYPLKNIRRMETKFLNK